MIPTALRAATLMCTKTLCFLVGWSLAAGLFAQTPAPGVTLIHDVRIFDGKAERLSGPAYVLVRGNKIERISATPLTAAPGATVIDGGGRTLMPGLIDMHWHAALVRPTPAQALAADVGYSNLVAGAEATDTLMRGFTTVRDLGGPVFGLKRAIDEGIVAGPRIYPSGAVITVTSGHGDFRQPYELPRMQGSAATRMEVLGAAVVADSPDEVRLRSREQLMLGATQIKLTGGGGVASPHSPLDVVTFTEPELRAAVEAADNWGTYVTVHAYTPESIQRAIAAGVRCIEHGHLMDEPTAKLMADRGIWLSIQPFPDEMAHVFPPGSDEAQKAAQVLAATETAYRAGQEIQAQDGFRHGHPVLAALAQRQGELLTRLSRWYTPAQALVMATSTNAELLALSGKRNPYPGKLGVVEEGALADLLLVDGNPIENINLLADPRRNFLLIMKDGKVYKNTVPKT